MLHWHDSNTVANSLPTCFSKAVRAQRVGQSHPPTYAVYELKVKLHTHLMRVLIMSGHAAYCQADKSVYTSWHGSQHHMNACSAGQSNKLFACRLPPIERRWTAGMSKNAFMNRGYTFQSPAWLQCNLHQVLLSKVCPVK